MQPTTTSAVTEFGPDGVDEAVAVLCDSFHAYPVMRYILRDSGPDYDDHLDRLVRFWTLCRLWKRETILAARDASGIAGGIALVSRSTPSDPNSEMDGHREQMWAAIGAPARSRYNLLGKAWNAFDPTEPHHHLNMIGVRRSYAGRGMGRSLMDEVHRRSGIDPDSTGVALTTEVPENVPLYRHFGYAVVGHLRPVPEVETWGFFRPND